MDSQDVTLTLNIDKINVILAALSELPFKTSAELISTIRTQVISQLETKNSEKETIKKQKETE